MEGNIKTSVVIPTWRRHFLLLRCLGMLVTQDMAPGDFEIIVVSDGPDQLLHRLIHRFAIANSAHTIRFLCHAVNKGPAAARNTGCKNAVGNLIVFTDDDCVPCSGWLSAYRDAWIKQGLRPEIAFTGKVTVPVPRVPTDYAKNVAQLEKAEFVTANCACTRAVLKKVKGFDEAFTLAWREDSELQFRLLESPVDILPVDNAEIIHPVRLARWGVSLREQRKSMFNALLFKKHPRLYQQRIGAKPLWNYYAMVLLLPLSLLLLAYGWLIATLAAVAAWLYLTARFTLKRLSGTSTRPVHVYEMIVTSLLIPFLSVFWTLYGAVRFKKWFL